MKAMLVLLVALALPRIAGAEHETHGGNYSLIEVIQVFDDVTLFWSQDRDDSAPEAVKNLSRGWARCEVQNREFQERIAYGYLSSEGGCSIFFSAKRWLEFVDEGHRWKDICRGLLESFNVKRKTAEQKCNRYFLDTQVDKGSV